MISNKIDNVLTNSLIETRLNKRVSIVNYSCHPTVLSSDNQLLSADFLFGLYASAKKDFEMLSFINGSSANISTRFTRNNQTIEEAFRLGHRLYSQIEMDSKKNNSLLQIETHFSFINLKVKN
ncbi:hypothetical protein [Virgibacillus proomii]|uniref:hypothetical protein n=1 Tax=Virgibacillus proomii TaxID=84407 RepID=UPI001C0F3EC6|nr:hypothetical protein [Virgibacillus proomii]MBU5268109.1 hypothetical protein [Virgibacillus proomii]